MPTTSTDRLKQYGLENFNPVYQLGAERGGFKFDVSTPEAIQKTRSSIEQHRLGLINSGGNPDVGALEAILSDLVGKKDLYDKISLGNALDDATLNKYGYISDAQRSTLEESKKIGEMGYEKYLKSRPDLSNKQVQDIITGAGDIQKALTSTASLNPYTVPYRLPELSSSYEARSGAARSILSEFGFAVPTISNPNDESRPITNQEKLNVGGEDVNRLRLLYDEMRKNPQNYSVGQMNQMKARIEQLSKPDGTTYKRGSQEYGNGESTGYGNTVTTDSSGNLVTQQNNQGQTQTTQGGTTQTTQGNTQQADTTGNSDVNVLGYSATITGDLAGQTQLVDNLSQAGFQPSDISRILQAQGVPEDSPAWEAVNNLQKKQYTAAGGARYQQMMGNISSFLPPEMGGVMDAMNAKMTALMNTEDWAKEMYTSGLLDAERLAGNRQALISSFLQDAKDDRDLAMQSALNQREDQLKMLDKFESQADAKLQWEEEKRVRNLTREKIKTADRLIAEAALTGASWSPNQFKYIHEVERELDQNIEDFKTDMFFKRQDVALQVTEWRNKAASDYASSIATALSEYRKEKNNLATQALNSDEELDKERRRLLEIKDKAISDGRTKLADDLLEINKFVVTESRAEKTRLDAQKRNAMDDYIKAASTFTAESPIVQQARKIAQEAGWSLEDVSGDNVPFALLQKKAEQEARDYSVPESAYEDERKLGLYASALAVSGKFFSADSKPVYDRYKKLIEDGKYDQVLSDMVTVASSKMGEGAKKIQSNRKTIINKTSELLEILDAVENTGQWEKFKQVQKDAGDAFKIYMEDKGLDWESNEDWGKLSSKDFNWYTNKLQQLRNKIGINMTPELKEIYARVENIAGGIISERFGSAVTTGEMERARNYIAMSDNTLEDMKINLRTFGEYSIAAYKDLLGEQGIDPRALGNDFFGWDTDTMGQSSTFTPPTPEDLEKLWEEGESAAYMLGDDVGIEQNGYLSKEYDGRKVTLAPDPMYAFEMANREFKRAYGQDIRIGDTRYSTTRDQTETIKYMADAHGIEFDEGNPNRTAAKLRDLGYQVADVGYSKHEFGQAVDLYPKEITINGNKYTGSEYIALVQPFLEAYGFSHETYGGKDVGNFEFTLNTSGKALASLTNKS